MVEFSFWLKFLEYEVVIWRHGLLVYRDKPTKSNNAKEKKSRRLEILQLCPMTPTGKLLEGHLNSSVIMMVFGSTLSSPIDTKEFKALKSYALEVAFLQFLHPT